MHRSFALLLVLCAACFTEHGKGGGMVCQGLVFVPSPQAPAEVTSCTSNVDGDPQTLYASCDGFPNLFECVAPNGSGVCIDGRRTTLCQLDTDCIPGFRCADSFLGVGTCEKECTVDLDCIRCELFCDTRDGVCSELIAMPGEDL